MVSWLDKRTDPTSPEDLEFLVKHYSLDCLTRILFSSEAAAVENQGDRAALNDATRKLARAMNT